MNTDAGIRVRAGEIRHKDQWSNAADSIALDYDARFLRRKVLSTSGGLSVLLDLAQTTSLEHGDALALEDGRLVEVIAAPEPVLRITGDLPRLAWHIGNRHTPCQIEPDHLVIRDDPVIRHMLEHLGAGITSVNAPFTPEGGAYGHGRTHSHEHGHTAHDHDH
ncbi:Urease accessory protein UreE [Candidatus Rhodobacter oscarellae]|uniref:Urease accessory protein UreE n=1 Tax=Candidatus Rhodobacter oscarellae TaxID=1675527 RepID=A0A0J9GZD7_9RHOB|nr:urease accessory protein UreE [Candidatus Rhodobacter lobularis]KMW58843.1 Urease accessory protein UreE [Candidatus Rhodobacter lobularis]